MKNSQYGNKEDTSSPSTSSLPQTIKRRRTDSFSMYIQKVMKEVNPDLSISSTATKEVEKLVKDILEVIAGQAGRLVRYKKQHTLSQKDLEMAVCFILPGQMAKYAMYEGNKATIIYKLLHKI
ncbi:late histone H2B.L4-like [Pelobates fuscus]|uniref:late histone H2B.L4-like n=1 Tax=Pelobates fuscus TaxID=191477 RepID=UPI002FE4AA03